MESIQLPLPHCNAPPQKFVSKSTPANPNIAYLLGENAKLKRKCEKLRKRTEPRSLAPLMEALKQLIEADERHELPPDGLRKGLWTWVMTYAVKPDLFPVETKALTALAKNS